MKTILLAVVGLSPQVITETLYALHQQGRQINAIHAITTRQGKEAIYAHLLSPTDGHYHRYLREYNRDCRAIAFGHDHIHVVADLHGNEIDDIEDEESNEQVLKTCLDIAYEFTKDPDSAVFFSIAGGRKTMSACLMVAAQCYGRPQDRVFHVLVSPEFESNRDFYYPPRENTPILLKDRQGRPYTKDSRHAELKIVSLPFISIRSQLSGAMLKSPKAPTDLMLSLVREDAPSLIVDMKQNKVIYKQQECDLMPARMALFAFFAMQKKNCLHPKTQSCRHCRDCYLDFSGISARQEEIGDLYRRCSPQREPSELSDTGILGLTAENFNSYKGKIKKDMETAFGPYTAKHFVVEGHGKKPDTRYGIPLDRERIRVVL